jgi:hypothetical protein
MHEDNGGYFRRIRELARLRTELLLDGEPSKRAIATRVGISPTTVGEWLDNGAFPQDVGKVIKLLEFVRAEARRQGQLGGCRSVIALVWATMNRSASTSPACTSCGSVRRRRTTQEVSARAEDANRGIC